RQMLPGPRMHHHGSGHDDHFATLLANAPQLPGDLLDNQLNSTLAGNSGAHKAKFGGGFATLVPNFRVAHSTDALDSHHYFLARFKIANQAAGSDRLAFSGRDDDHSIHALFGHAHPSAIDVDFGRVDRGDIEIVRRDAV